MKEGFGPSFLEISDVVRAPTRGGGSGGTRKVPIRGNPFKPNQITGWLVVASTDDGKEMPASLPDGTKLHTKMEKAAKDFEDAGRPMGGAQDD